MARRTRAEAEATRESLLDAAEQVFYDKGVARATLQDIARTAGVTRGALYWHFKDKADLFGAMLERVRMPLEDLIDAIPAGERSESVLETLRMASLLALGQMEQPRIRRIHSIIIHRCEVFGEFDPVAMLRELSESASANTLELFRQARDNDELVAEVDAETANQTFHCILRGLLHHWHLDTDAYSLSETGTRLINQWFELIGKASLKPAARPGS